MDFINRNGWKRLSLSILSGLALILIFQPFNLHLLAWVALVPLMLAISGREKLDAFKLGMVTGIIYFAGVMHWLVTVLNIYGHIPMLLSLPLVLLLVVYLSLFIGLYAWGITHIGKMPEKILLSAPLFAVTEYLRSYLFSGFPWALLADSQAGNLPMIQLASLTGTAGITFLIVLLNSAFAFYILKLKEGEKVPLIPAIAILAVLANYGWGKYQINRVESIKGRELLVSVVQGNIDQGRKWDRKFRDEVINDYFELTRKEATKKLDLIVWPETAMPFYFGLDMLRTAKLLKLSSEIGTPIIFGGMGREGSYNSPNKKYYNRSFVISDGKLLGTYDKMHLVPFGEYVPLRTILFFVDKLTDAIGVDISAGERADPVTVDGIPLGIGICFEIKFPAPTRKFVNNGARLMVNITNDAWFGNSGASAQHMASLPFRAVENRVSIVRSANTGISGFVSPTGRMYGLTGLYKKTTVSKNVKVLEKSGTFYTAYGDVFIFICVIATMLALRFREKKEI